MRTNMRLLVAGLILMSACVARAQDLSKPMVLVASPDLAGPYSHTALIVVPMGDRHIGFILNRATESRLAILDRKSTRLNSSHLVISYAVFCLKKKKTSIRN